MINGCADAAQVALSSRPSVWTSFGLANASKLAIAVSITWSGSLSPKWSLELFNTVSCLVAPTQRVQVAKRKKKEKKITFLSTPARRRAQLRRGTKRFVSVEMSSTLPHITQDLSNNINFKETISNNKQTTAKNSVPGKNLLGTRLPRITRYVSKCHYSRTKFYY